MMGIIGIIVFIAKVMLPEILAIGLLMLILFAAGESSITRRLIKSLFVVAIYLFIRVGDPYLGKIYTQKLCDENSTFEVYKTVIIPDSYWNEDGRQIFSGRLFEIEGTSYEESRSTERESTYSFFDIRRETTVITDRSTNENLGASVNYNLYRSWYSRVVDSSQHLNYSCGGYTEKTDSLNSTLKTRVFLPATERTPK